MTQNELVKRIDHTLLSPEATVADVDRVVDEALEYGFAAVCVAPVFVKHVSRRLAASGERTCSVIGFPHGTHKSTLKAIEATAAVKDGADELDVVAHLPNLLAMDVAAAQAELSEVVRGARAVRRDVVVKVIIETALLLRVHGDRGEEAIAAACRAVQQSGCDFVKTSTGFHPAGGATVEAVRLLRRHADALQVKAAGGIRDRATALAMLEAGADRLGMSGSVRIVGSRQQAAGSRQQAVGSRQCVGGEAPSSNPQVPGKLQMEKFQVSKAWGGTGRLYSADLWRLSGKAQVSVSPRPVAPRGLLF